MPDFASQLAGMHFDFVRMCNRLITQGTRRIPICHNARPDDACCSRRIALNGEHMHSLNHSQPRSRSHRQRADRLIADNLVGPEHHGFLERRSLDAETKENSSSPVRPVRQSAS